MSFAYFSSSNVFQRSAPPIKRSAAALIMVLCCILSSSPGFALDFDDTWIGPDKIVHTVVSCALSFLFYNLYKKNTSFSRNESCLAAFFTTISAGTVKELFDERFSAKDLTADAVGAGMGLGFAIEF